jgi:hypothetical protein
MAVGLPTAVDTAELDPDREAVQLFRLGGLTVSRYLIPSAAHRHGERDYAARLRGIVGPCRFAADGLVAF